MTDGIIVLENIYGWSRISVAFEKKPEPADDNARLIARVNGNQVYRATEKNGKYKVVYKSSTGSTKTYTDSKSLEKGKKYYYKIRGVRIIDGKKYYTGYSKTVGRTVK